MCIRDRYTPAAGGSSITEKQIITGRADSTAGGRSWFTLDGDNINLWIDSNYNLYNSMKTNYNILLGQHNNLDYFSVPINKEIYSKFERELDLCQN